MFAEGRFYTFLKDGTAHYMDAVDESLEEHDRRFHGGMFDGRQSCSKRDVLGSKDEVDGVPNGGTNECRVVACGMYYGTGLREIAHGIKNGDAGAIRTAAQMMSKKIPRGALLVPMPGHDGDATTIKSLAECMAGMVEGCEVLDVLKSNKHESSYAAKKRGVIGGCGITMRTEGSVPREREVVVVDNVISSGETWRAAQKAIPNSRLVVLADARGTGGRGNV